MKYLPLIVMAFCLSACKHLSYVEFNGTVTGVKDGVFAIKDQSGKILYGENIMNGKFHIDKKEVEAPGYYTMDIIDNANKDEKHTPYEIYLEDGAYTIDNTADKLTNYPKVTSSSPVQQQLSAYYTLADELAGDINKQQSILNARVKSKAAITLQRDDYTELLNNLSALEIKKQSMASKALDQFVTKNPQNTIGAHVMLRMDFDSDPSFFNGIYKRLSPDVRNSDEGKEIGEKLGALVKLVAGAEAPPISGKLLNGAAFDPKAMHKKIFLVDFWRAANDISRNNHQVLKRHYASLSPKGFEIISVSMDVHQDWWSKAVKDDAISWTQVSDLKGDDSPNTKNWSVTRIPTYYLVDGNWHIIERDVTFNTVALGIEEYLKKHP